MLIHNYTYPSLTNSSIVAYSTLQLTLLLIVGIFASAVGSYVFWLVQKKFEINTKTMLLINVVFM